MPQNHNELLKKDLKKILANDICSAQCLDVPADRNRVLNQLLKFLDKNYKFQKKCLGCGWPMDPEEVRNALSRYKHGYICSECGVREALNGDFITDRQNNG